MKMKRKPLLRPDLRFSGVTAIDPARLLSRGIRGLLLDLDNTLTNWHGMEISTPVQAWLKQATAAGLQLCILSNGHAERVRPIREMLGIPALHMSGKPRPSAFRRGCQELGLPPEQVAMVGDQLFTDVLGGNMAGLTTILLTELIDPHEMWWTKHVARPLERLLVRCQRKQA